MSEQHRQRRREREESDAPQRFQQEEIGRIVALASELQAREQAAAAPDASLDREQVLAMAAELGLDPRFVEQALEAVRAGTPGIPVRGSIDQVRQALLKHFASVSLTLPMESSVAGRVSLDAAGAITVDWNGRQLRMELHDGPAGTTLVSWDARLDPGEKSMLATKICAPIFGLIAIASAYADLGLLSGIFFATLLIIYAVEKIDASDSERKFIEFCRTHLENVQLLATSPSCASPSAAPEATG